MKRAADQPVLPMPLSVSAMTSPVVAVTTKVRVQRVGSIVLPGSPNGTYSYSLPSMT